MKTYITILLLAITTALSAQNEWYAPSVFYQNCDFNDTLFQTNGTDTLTISTDSNVTTLQRNNSVLTFNGTAAGIGNVSTGIAYVATDSGLYMQDVGLDTVLVTFTNGPANNDTVHFHYTGAFWDFQPPLSTFNTGSGWSLTGNSGTTPGTNFIGTTDSKSLYFKTKGTTAIVVDTNQNVGIGTTTPTLNLQVNGPVGLFPSAFVDFVANKTDINLTVRNSLSESSGLVFDSLMVGSIYSKQLNVSGTDSIRIESPQIKLLINGTPAAGEVLTSDANGNATWLYSANKVDLTSQTAAIAATSITGTDSAGFYMLDFYLVNSVADAGAGDVSITITWNDGIAARTITSGALALTGNGFINHVTGTATENAIYKDGSGPIQFSTTVNTPGSAAYDVHIRVENGY